MRLMAAGRTKEDVGMRHDPGAYAPWSGTALPSQTTMLARTSRTMVTGRYKVNKLLSTQAGTAEKLRGVRVERLGGRYAAEGRQRLVQTPLINLEGRDAILERLNPLAVRGLLQLQSPQT